MLLDEVEENQKDDEKNYSHKNSLMKEKLFSCYLSSDFLRLHRFVFEFCREFLFIFFITFFLSYFIFIVRFVISNNLIDCIILEGPWQVGHSGKLYLIHPAEKSELKPARVFK